LRPLFRQPSDKAQLSREVREILSRVTAPVPDAGKVVGLSRNGSYSAARKGQIPTLRFGKKIIVPMAQFRRMLGLPEVA
jgi:hypothetical protein